MRPGPAGCRRFAALLTRGGRRILARRILSRQMSGTNVTQQDRDIVAAALTHMGLLGAGETFSVDALVGGVSCDVWHVKTPSRDMVLKRALSKLRVATEWRAPTERASTEADWFRFVETIDPRLVPEVLGEDRAHHIFAMEYLSPDTT